MGMTLTGTVKNGGAYEITGKDGSKRVMISFNVADELGNTYACQMWPDDPQHAELAGMITQLRRQPVQLVVVSYTSRMREFKDGKPAQPQTNFIVSNVVFPNIQRAASASYADAVPGR